jgi:hypothetical protein
MDDDRHAHRRWGVIVGGVGLAIAGTGIWLGTSVGWDLEPSAAYVNQGRDAARGAIAVIALGVAASVVGAIVAFAPYGRR